LLSATLPAQTARRLVDSYLQGAGKPTSDDYEILYPGWLWADGTTETITPVSVKAKPRDLKVSIHEVPLDGTQTLVRATALHELLTPVIEAGEGCVGVICNTVGEAQQTYRDLAAWFTKITEAGGTAPELSLLHSRFPAVERERITDDIVAKFSKKGTRTGRRPDAAVVVATQVIEQSLDLDLDLIVSDLAPIALLLQRAGRCWRHDHTRRPSWSSGPRLAVLVPPVDRDGKPVVPTPWPYVYPIALLRRTRELLLRRNGASIRIPEDVQSVVDHVYDETFADGSMEPDDMERIADQQVKDAVAAMTAIPEPWDCSDLHKLTERDLDDELFRTRLGADTGRVLCCYRDSSGALWLDQARRTRLPGLDGGRPTRDEVRMLLSHTIPVPGAWLAGRGDDHAPPETWSRNVHLRDLVLLPHPIDADGRIRPAQIESNSLRLHPLEGLVRLA
jgi:CRISPR-associated endonuclease/helicase Cas3